MEDNTQTPDDNTHVNDRSDKVKETDVYKAIEAMISVEVTRIAEYLTKQKDAKTKTSKEHYGKKIVKAREKALKYMFQLNKLTGENVEDVLKDIEEEKEKADEEE